MQAYEERYLFLLLLLRQPRARLIYVTAQADPPGHRRLLPRPAAGRHPESRQEAPGSRLAARRLDRALAREAPRAPAPARADPVADPRPRPRAPGALRGTEEDKRARARARHPDVRRRPQVPSTSARRAAAGGSSRRRASPCPSARRTSTASRRRCADPARDAPGAPRPARRSWSSSTRASPAGQREPDAARGCRRRATRARPRPCARAVERWRSSSATLTYDDFLEKLAEQGRIVEERIEAEQIESPSVQLRVTPLGDVELLSTHDQLLGGTGGHVLPGLPLPRRRGVRAAHQPRGAQGRPPARSRRGARPLRPRLRRGAHRRGGLGAVRHRDQPAQGRDDAPLPHAAVPHRRHLRPGDRRTSRRRRGSGSTSWRATTWSPRPTAAFTHDDLFDIVAIHGLHFDQTRQTGVVFHMLSALPECGRVGLTAVADSPGGSRRRSTNAPSRRSTRGRAARQGRSSGSSSAAARGRWTNAGSSSNRVRVWSADAGNRRLAPHWGQRTGRTPCRPPRR